MEGELELLEAAWQQADEVAGIADNLLVPGEVDEFVAAEKERAPDAQRIIVPAGAGISAPGERTRAAQEEAPEETDEPAGRAIPEEESA